MFQRSKDKTIVDINNFIQEYLTINNIDEITTRRLADVLDKNGLLKDNKNKLGLPLRIYLRANKILGSFQLENNRWIIKRIKDYEPFLNLDQVSKETYLSKFALYKRINRKTLKVKKHGDTIAIPYSEVEKLKSDSDEEKIDVDDKLKNDILIIKSDLEKLLYKVNEVESLINSFNKLIKGVPMNNTTSSITLHDEIREILLKKGKPMTTSEIAVEVNKRGIYKKKDGSEISAFQIHGRTKNYPLIFTRDSTVVSLKEWNKNE